MTASETNKNELLSLKGIGPKTAGALERLGIYRVEDLLHYYPRDYELYGAPKPLYQLTPGQTEAVEGVLVREPVLNLYRGMRIVNAYLADMTGRLQLSWYNMPYIKGALKIGQRYVFRGRVYEKNGRLLMYQPKVMEAESYRKSCAGRLFPVYPLTKGVTGRLLQTAVAEALKGQSVREYLPEEILQRQALSGLSEAYQGIHFPKGKEELLRARKRLSFDELFLFLLEGGRRKRRQERQASAYRCRPDLRLIRFIAELPYSLTGAQQKALKEIMADMSSGWIMNRLVEGDVGSGKTVVGFLAMLYAGLNGFQSVLMAPTEVLAEQHYETVRSFLNRGELPLSAVLLKGSMTAAEKRAALERIRNHEADMIVGTHALFQQQVDYDRLGLVVTDEQHRFGVAQRYALTEKGGAPHVLLMSATPIPRTLAGILYEDLALSVIDALPEGRREIKNCVVGPSYRKTAWKFILEELRKGHQAYVICPMIEKPEAGEGQELPETTLFGTEGLENVTEYAERLRGMYPPEIRIGVLHGKMKAQEKDQVMTAFQEGSLQLLVSTTVVEVGVDVPNATVMMIENADRFGLAQLHQLRGRVGRGKAQSYCIMINTSDSERAAERLEILNHSNDGFYIANEDLRLRGPGDVFGLRQSGELRFRIADIYQDAELMQAAREESGRILSEDPELQEHRALLERLRHAFPEEYRGA